MTARLLLLADTHVPRRAKDLPPMVWRWAEEAYLVVHAGDWVDESLLDALEARSRQVLGCWGNNDGAGLRARLPEVARCTVEGVRLAVVHETGPKGGREARMDAAVPDADVLVFGHNHIPWDSVTPGGMRLLNPGSPTDRRRQPTGTVMRVRIGPAEEEEEEAAAAPVRDRPQSEPAGVRRVTVRLERL